MRFLRTDYVEGNDFYGSINPVTGEISYGNAAFSSYDALLGTYVKERFHSVKVKRRESLATQDAPFIKNGTYFPEEALGFEHAYKNQDLFRNVPLNYRSSITFYQSQSINFSGSCFDQKWWHGIYRIPRRY